MYRDQKKQTETQLYVQSLESVKKEVGGRFVKNGWNLEEEEDNFYILSHLNKASKFHVWIMDCTVEKASYF